MSKNAIFPFFFFPGNIHQENVFYDILQRKIAFLGYKNVNLKQSKNWHFLKRANPWFRLKNGHFSNFSFLAIYARKMSFLIIYNEKNAFLGYKNKNLKNGLFFKFFFRQYRPGKCLLWYSGTQKRFSRL